MNGMNDTNQTGNNEQGRAPVAFCQNCGKPLSDETKRVVGPAVYCEPCLAARLGGAPASGSAWQWGAGVPPAWDQGVGVKSGPNPGLAALLGLIPGVGAMYNEQYAKGLVHLLIFTVLVGFAHATDLFVLFVLGWLAYMSIEAHHTARARRDGTPLPNPFGLNDIGERLGFGKAWPPGPGVGTVARDAADAAAAGFSQAASVPGSGPGYPPSPAPGYAPVDAPGYAAGSAPGFGPGYAAGAGVPPVGGPGSAGPSAAGQSQGFAGDPGWGAPVDSYAYGAGYGGVYGAPNPYVAPMPAVPPPPINRFPAGAVWLIGLGTIFLLGTTGIFRDFPGLALVGLVLLGMGIWTFVRRMTETGATLADDGTPLYRLRLVRALRGSSWLVLLGVLFLLDTFRVVRWAYSWPWLIILGGVLMLLNRAVYQPMAGVGYGPAAPVPQPAAAPAGTAMVPAAEAEASHRNDADSSTGGN